MNSYFSRRTAYAVAAAAVLGSAALAGPVLAADTLSTQPRAQMGAASDTMPAKKASPTATKAKPDQVEQRLITLHRELKIAPQQEDKWNAFAQTVRDNESRMRDLLTSRHQARNASAVDDLKTYGELTDEHAKAIKRLESPFGDLYASMNDAQKRNADQVFAKYEGRSETRQVGAAAKPKS
jgi:hypothetical protein